MNLYFVPVTNQAQLFGIKLGGVPYNLTLQYRDAVQGGWILDIADQNNTPLLQGIPLVAGVDLLGQYGYFNFGGKLGLFNSIAPDAVPTYTNLGTDCQLVWATP